MTLIVAFRDNSNKIHFASDRAANNGAISRNLTHPKFWGICGGYKVGISGDYFLNQALQYRAECPVMEIGEDPFDYIAGKLVVEYERVIDGLRCVPQEQKSYFDGVIAHSSGRLFFLDSRLAVQETNDHFVATGSGESAAYPLWDVLYRYYGPEKIFTAFTEMFLTISKYDQYVSREFDYEVLT